MLRTQHGHMPSELKWIEEEILNSRLKRPALGLHTHDSETWVLEPSLVSDLNFWQSRRGICKRGEGKWGQQAGGQEKILAGTVTEPTMCCVQCTGYWTGIAKGDISHSTLGIGWSYPYEWSLPSQGLQVRVRVSAEDSRWWARRMPWRFKEEMGSLNI